MFRNKKVYFVKWRTNNQHYRLRQSINKSSLNIKIRKRIKVRYKIQDFIYTQNLQIFHVHPSKTNLLTIPHQISRLTINKINTITTENIRWKLAKLIS